MEDMEMDIPSNRPSLSQPLIKAGITLLAWMLFMPINGMAQPYLIDGVVPDAGCCTEFPDPAGSVSELGPVNASGTKLSVIHNEDVPMLDFTNPNSSTDLKTIWLETWIDPANDDIWLYFGWERDANTGSSVIAYEFQTAAVDPACDYSGIDQVEPESAAETDLIASCNPWANRQADDFMIVWDFGGGSTDIILRTFNGTDFNSGVNISESGFAIAALNGDSSRGEGIINLTAAIFGAQDSCFNVANVIPGTITGNSDSADYKDTVLADIRGSLTISNCGMVNITKATQPAGESGNFDYTMNRLGGEAIDFAGNLSAGGTLIDDGGSTELTVLPGNNYSITEDLTSEPTFELQSIVCDKPAPGTDITDGTAGFEVAVSETTDCVITNELLTGSITVKKYVENTYGGTAVPSDFCLSLGELQPAPFPGDADGTQFTFVIGNQYSVSEVACGDPDTTPPGYFPEFSGQCFDESIEARVDKLCEVTNKQKAQDTAGLTLFKTVINDNGGTAPSSAWTLNASLKSGSAGTCTEAGFNGEDADDGNGVNGSLSVSDDLATCIYELSETGGPGSGYTPSNWSCSGDVDLNGNEITIGATGGSCTIINDDNAPSLTLVKEVTNDNGGTAVPGDWTLTAAGYDAASPGHLQPVRVRPGWLHPDFPDLFQQR
jgi:hypothetical protein